VKQTRTALVVVLVLFSTALAAACGEGSESATTTTGSWVPVEVEGTVIPARPERIVSASPTATEVLYALGAGDRVVATDLFSNHPPAAEEKAQIDAYNVSVEALAGFSPDLVILAFDPGDVQAGLAALGVPSLLFSAPTTLDDVYGQMAALGAATGLEAEAASLTVEMREGIEAVVASVPAADGPVTYYYELDPTFYSVTSTTFIGSLLGMLGMESIADGSDPDGLGYPQLSPEYILEVDPDFILLADTKCCGQSAETVAVRPGWDTLGAVVAGRVITLDDDVASRWSPRLVDLLAAVVEGVYAPVGAG